MRMRMISSLLLCLVFIAASCAETEPLGKEALNGSWYILPQKEVDPLLIQSKSFGWGDGVRIVNGTTEIDLVEKTILIPGLFLMEIIEVNELESNTFEIRCYFENGDFEVSYICHFVEENQMWMEYKGQAALHNETGPNHPYYRMVLPESSCPKNHQRWINPENSSFNSRIQNCLFNKNQMA